MYSHNESCLVTNFEKEIVKKNKHYEVKSKILFGLKTFYLNLLRPNLSMDVRKFYELEVKAYIDGSEIGEYLPYKFQDLIEMELIIVNIVETIEDKMDEVLLRKINDVDSLMIILGFKKIQ